MYLYIRIVCSTAFSLHSTTFPRKSGTAGKAPRTNSKTLRRTNFPSGLTYLASPCFCATRKEDKRDGLICYSILGGILQKMTQKNNQRARFERWDILGCSKILERNPNPTRRCDNSSTSRLRLALAILYYSSSGRNLITTVLTAEVRS